MLDKPLAIGIDEEHQVTAIISHVIRSGRERGYEEWLRGIIVAAKRFDGHMGIGIIRPREHVHPEYVAILRFDRYNNLKKWLESDVRRDWIERLQPLIEKPEDVQTLTGLETWFTLPEKLLKAPPPRYKMVLVTWLGVFVTLTLVSRLLAPLLSNLPRMLDRLITTGIVVALLTYLVMPCLTEILQGWLYPKHKS